jgi:hypothetical protein
VFVSLTPAFDLCSKGGHASSNINAAVASLVITVREIYCENLETLSGRKYYCVMDKTAVGKPDRKRPLL